MLCILGYDNHRLVVASLYLHFASCVDFCYCLDTGMLVDDITVYVLQDVDEYCLNITMLISLFIYVDWRKLHILVLKFRDVLYSQ